MLYVPLGNLKAADTINISFPWQKKTAWHLRNLHIKRPINGIVFKSISVSKAELKKRFTK